MYTCVVADVYTTLYVCAEIDVEIGICHSIVYVDVRMYAGAALLSAWDVCF